MSNKNTTKEYQKILMLKKEDVKIQNLYNEYLNTQFLNNKSLPSVLNLCEGLTDILIGFLQNPNTDYSMVPQAVKDTFVGTSKDGKFNIPLNWEVLNIEKIVKAGIENNNIAGLRELAKIDAALLGDRAKDPRIKEPNEVPDSGYSLNDLKVLSMFLNELGKERFAKASLSKIFKGEEHNIAERMIVLNNFTKTIVENNYDEDFNIVENSVLRAMFKSWKEYKDELIHIKDSFDEEYGPGAFVIYSNKHQIVQVNNYLRFTIGYLNNKDWHQNDFINEFEELLNLGFVNGGSIVFARNYPISYLDMESKQMFLNDCLEESTKNNLYQQFRDKASFSVLENVNAMVDKDNPYQRNNIVEMAQPFITALSKKVENLETLTQEDKHTLAVISYDCFDTQTNLSHLLPLLFKEVDGNPLIESISSDEQIAKYIWVTLDDMVETFEHSIKNKKPLGPKDVQDIVKCVTEIIIFTKNDPDFSEQYKDRIINLETKVDDFIENSINSRLIEKTVIEQMQSELAVLRIHLDELLMKIDVPVAPKGTIIRKM